MKIRAVIEYEIEIDELDNPRNWTLEVEKEDLSDVVSDFCGNRAEVLEITSSE